MNNIQYFSNGVRRFQTGGQVSYKGMPAASKNLDQQFLADLKKWQNGEIGWTDEMSRYYTNVSTDTKYNKAGRQWQEVNKEVKTWDTPGAVDSEGRISLPAVTITAKRPRKEEELKDIYGIPYSYSDSDRAFIRHMQERPNYKGLMQGMNAAAIAPGLLALSGVGTLGTAGTRAFQTLTHVGKTGAPSTTAQYFSAQPLSFGTKLALTADGTAVAIPSVSVNIPSMLPSLGASTVLGKLLYDGRTMNAESSEARSQRLAQEAEQANSSETSTPEPPKEPEKKEEPNNTPEPKDNNPKNKLDNVKQWGKKAWKWGRIPLIGYGLYSAYNAGRQVEEGNKRLGNPQDQAMQGIMQLQGQQPIHLDTLPYEESLRYLDSLNKISQQTKIDTLD